MTTASVAAINGHAVFMPDPYVGEAVCVEDLLGSPLTKLVETSD